jgi:microcystin-dependent protein
MADPFIGEIKMISWNYPPRYWAFCDGSILAIATNQALFSLLSTTYGGNGVQTFALPDLRARTPLGQGQGQQGPAVTIGAVSGEPSHTVVLGEYPAHTHQMMGTATAGTSGQPEANGYVASYEQAFGPVPTDPSKRTTLDPSDISTAGSNQAHENRQPYLCVPMVIALSGIYPSRN